MIEPHCQVSLKLLPPSEAKKKSLFFYLIKFKVYMTDFFFYLLD